MLNITLKTGEILQYHNGESLLQTLKRYGIYLTASCGGKGICGKCRVRVRTGKTRTESRGKIDLQDMRGGIVLACQTFPQEDLLIEIPRESRIVVGDTIEISSADALVEVFQSLDATTSPLVKSVALEMPSPTLSDNVSDFERLQRTLRKNGLSDIFFSYDFFHNFSHVLRKTGWEVNLTYTEDRKAVSLTDADSKMHWGIAADIGTTTTVVYLTDLETGRVIDVGSTYNSQIRFGDDVITRIIYATEGGGLGELRSALVDDINNLINPLIEKHGISSNNINSVVIAGNTTMEHLFWGIDPKYIREEPYTPTLNTFPFWDAETAGLHVHSNAPVYTLPCVASYIGGDIVAGVLASKMHRHEPISLFMDIGTNGEIVIGNNEWLITAACSAGPCFEGSGIKNGMRATKGAVQAVRIDPRTFEPELDTIGNSASVGICGSGMIDVITELFVAGAINQKGKFRKDRRIERIREGFDGMEFLLYKDGQNEIVLTEVDIENIIRAKAAIYAGISLLLNEVGLTFENIEHIYIAGGFGNYLHIDKAITLGMLPDLPKERFSFLGNTSIAGAYLCLLSKDLREEAEEIAKKMTNVELSVSRHFMDEYMSAMFLPHTDMNLFPSVARLLQGKLA